MCVLGEGGEEGDDGCCVLSFLLSCAMPVMRRKDMFEGLVFDIGTLKICLYS